MIEMILDDLTQWLGTGIQSLNTPVITDTKQRSRQRSGGQCKVMLQTWPLPLVMCTFGGPRTRPGYPVLVLAVWRMIRWRGCWMSWAGDDGDDHGVTTDARRMIQHGLGRLMTLQWSMMSWVDGWWSWMRWARWVTQAPHWAPFCHRLGVESGTRQLKM